MCVWGRKVVLRTLGEEKCVIIHYIIPNASQQLPRQLTFYLNGIHRNKGLTHMEDLKAGAELLQNV